MLFQGILIECFQKINQDRTTSSVYNLLIGKKAIQTIQDARFYHIADYYGIYPDLTKTDYYQQLQQLLERNYLLADDEQRLQITKKDRSGLQPIKQRLLDFMVRLTKT